LQGLEFFQEAADCHCSHPKLVSKLSQWEVKPLEQAPASGKNLEELTSVICSSPELQLRG
jgi:hypothetical protein